MDDPDLVVIKYVAPKPDKHILNYIKDAATQVQTNHNKKLECLKEIYKEDIVKIVNGPRHIVILFKDGRVARFSYKVKLHEQEKEEKKTAPPRRVVTNRPPPPRGSGVIVDRAARAARVQDVPEELITQAEVVLQGRSRDVIAAELIRTNLNVNEAVNNLLSRDDDQLSGAVAAADVRVSQELLSLLDITRQPGGAGGLGSILDEAYGGEFEYLHRGPDRRRPETNRGASGSSARKPEQPHKELSTVEIDDRLEFWSSNQSDAVTGLLFKEIACTSFEALGLAFNGKVYGWSFDEPHGSTTPHSAAERITGGKKVQMLEACHLRAVVATVTGSIGTWLDENKAGKRLGDVFDVPCRPQKIAKEHGTIKQLFCSNLFAGFITTHGFIYWCGVFPASDRKRLIRRSKNKLKKQTEAQPNIVEGSEVRNKSSPIFPAGSVAVKLTGGELKVGLLMENSWTLHEMCRFRVMDPSQYDLDLPLPPQQSRTKSVTFAGDSTEQPSRKRRASAMGGTGPSQRHREAAWNINDVIFIHKETVTDVAVVKIVDGDLCGVQYLPRSQSVTSKYTCGSAEDLDSAPTSVQKEKGIRLLRKENLIPHRSSMAQVPSYFQKESTRFRLPMRCEKLCSVAADNRGLRCLVFDNGQFFMVRVSMCGRILSKRTLPFFHNVPEAFDPGDPEIFQFGEDSALLVRMTNGSCPIPLIKDHDGGFYPLQPHNLHSTTHASVYVQSDIDPMDKHLKQVVVVGINVKSRHVASRQIPSMMKSVLTCDVDSTRAIIKQLGILQTPEDKKMILMELLKELTDNAGNVMHAAVLRCIAASNKDQVDDFGESALRGFDQHFRPSGATRQKMGLRPLVAENSQSSESGESIPSDNKTRQGNALKIFSILLNYLEDDMWRRVMLHKDVNGLTPLALALENRAYTCARLIIQSIQAQEITIYDICPPPPVWKGPKREHNNGWALFLLCYNDNCSFTWTATEHIHQDIYECRTCGIVGALCCCTECALTCHRGHDCVLKRTSPTAYCDCWEQCRCKALISGNQDQRLHLLNTFLEQTDSYKYTNVWGQHIVYFLAKTVARQTNEQAPFKNKSFPRQHDLGSNAPEHNMSPPSFAPRALKLCLSNFNVMKNFLFDMNAMSTVPGPRANMVDDTMGTQLAQNLLSEQLDMVVYYLIMKCPPEHMESLCDMLDSSLEKENEEAGKMIARITRSVLRLYSLLTSLCPTAAKIAATGVTKKKPLFERPEERRPQTFVDALIKDPKTAIVHEAIPLIHKFLERFSTFAIGESARMAVSLISPVIMGRTRAVNPYPANFSKDWDLLEVIENSLMPKPKRKFTKETKETKEKDTSDDSDMDTDGSSDDSETELPFSHRLNSTSSHPDEEGGGGPITVTLEMFDSSDDEEEESDEEEDDADEGQEEDAQEDGDEGDEGEMDANDELMDVVFQGLPAGQAGRAPNRAAARRATEQRAADDASQRAPVLAPNVAEAPRAEGEEAVQRVAINPASVEDEDEDEDEEASTNVHHSLPTTANVDHVREHSNFIRAAFNVNRPALFERSRTARVIRQRANRLNAAAGAADEQRRRLNTATTEAAEATQVAATTVTRAPERREIRAPEPEPAVQVASKEEAQRQLSALFYLLARVAYELTVEKLKKNQPDAQIMMNVIECEFFTAWKWLVRVMDSTEATVKLALNRRNMHPIKYDMREFLKVHEPSSSMSEYLVELMRTSAGEQGDRQPLLDHDQLRTLSLIADAFLIRCRAIDTFRKILCSYPPVLKEQIRFFSRGRDMTYPGISLKDGVDIMSDWLHYARNPLLLNTEYKKSQLFDTHQSSEAKFNDWPNVYLKRAGVALTASKHRPHHPLNAALDQHAKYVDSYWMTGKDECSVSYNNDKEIPAENSVLALREEVNNSLEVGVSSRWRHSLTLIGRYFNKDVLLALGSEISGSVLLTEYATHDTRQAYLRGLINDYEASHPSRELSIDNLHRKDDLLVAETVWQLNIHFAKRKFNKNNAPPSLYSQKLRVSFESEPGEGLGVSRSYFTDLAEALMRLEYLPFDDFGYGKGEEHLFGGPLPQTQSTSASNIFEAIVSAANDHRLPSSFVQHLQRRHAGQIKKKKRQLLRLNSAPYTPVDILAAEALSNERISPDEDTSGAPLDATASVRQHAAIADRIFIMVRKIYPHPLGAPRITGMLVDLSFPTGVLLTGCKDAFMEYIEDAIHMLRRSPLREDRQLAAKLTCDSTQPPDTAPLFYQMAGTVPFFVPCAGRVSPTRINAFRNVGRIIGLCLAQGQVFPLRLARHVWKYILDQEITFHDLAFADYALYDQLRSLLRDGMTLERSALDERLATMCFNFSITIPAEENDGMHPLSFDLRDNGSNIQVTGENLLEFVYEVSKARLERPGLALCLKSLRTGVYDTLPFGFLTHLSPDDMQLLCGGVMEVNIDRLRRLTSVIEECKASPQEVEKTLNWFWECISALTEDEKADLLFFWTGSSALPAMDDQFKPTPTIVLRNFFDDSWFPSANTCISRLYIPIYSNKIVMLNRIREAIKTRQFGFV